MDRLKEVSMALRPDLNGQRLRNPVDGAIYLVDLGAKRHVADPTAMNNIFNDWNTIEDVNVIDIDNGPVIDDFVVLAQGYGDAAVYLIDVTAGGARVKRHVASPATMAAYNFSWSKISHVPVGLIWGTPTGTQIG
jgi:hypothetical protein